VLAADLVAYVTNADGGVDRVDAQPASSDEFWQ